MKREILTISNLLSITRALLVIPFVLVMLLPDSPLRVCGAVILVVAMLTDRFDGILARKYHQETEWGRILDPLADKIGIAALALVLLWLGDIPVWFVVALVARDLLIFGGGMYIRFARGVVLPSNTVGKWAVGVISVTLFFPLVGLLPEVHEWLLWISALMLLVSFALYCARFVSVITTPPGRT
ncbi:MAG: CDP-alcohol phosphatidyltransferase family protein [Bacteroidota bacterium]